jgi:uncharacterized protein with PIN domain
MVLDTSALLAILQGEPQRIAFSDALESAGSRSRRPAANRCFTRARISR